MPAPTGAACRWPARRSIHADPSGSLLSRRRTRPFLRVRILRTRSMGSGPQPRADRCNGRALHARGEPPEHHAGAPPPPLQAPRPDGDLPAGEGAWRVRGRDMLPLPPDAADRRARAPLRRPGRMPALPPSAARAAGRHRGRALLRAPSHGQGREQAPPQGRLSRRTGCAATRLTAAVDPVTSKITIGRPREEVFDYLADIANHPEFCDHYLKDWRLTRIDSVGQGAGARFRRDKRFDRFGWEDMTFIEVARPYRIVAAGRGGKFNRTKTYRTWTLSPSSGGTEVEHTTESEPA